MKQLLPLFLRCIYALLLLLPAGSVHAQERQAPPFLLRYPPAEGLPSDGVYIYKLGKDESGYLWIASEYGVIKYNGYAPRLFTTSDGLPTNDIFNFFLDRQGRTWLFSMSHQLGFIRGGQYHKVKIPTHRRFIMPGKVQFRENNMYFNTQNHMDSVVFFCAGERYPDSICQAALPLRLVVPEGLTYRGQSADKLWFVDDHYLLSRDFARPFDTLRRSRRLDTGLNQVLIEFASRILFRDNGRALLWQNVSGDLFFVDGTTGKCRRVKLSALTAEPGEQAYIVCDDYNTPRLITSRSIIFFDSLLHVQKVVSWKSLLPSVAQLSFHLEDTSGDQWFASTADGLWYRPKLNNLFRPYELPGWQQGMRYLGRAYGDTYWTHAEKRMLLVTHAAGEPDRFSTEQTGDIRVVRQGLDNQVLLVAGNGNFLYDPHSKRLRNLLLRQDGMPFSRYFLGWQNDVHAYSQNDAQYLSARLFDLAQIRDDFFLGINARSALYIRTGEDAYIARHISNERYRYMTHDSCNKVIWLYGADNVAVYAPGLNTIFAVLNTDFLQRMGISNIHYIGTDRWGNVFIHHGNRLALFCPQKMVFREIPLYVNLYNSRTLIHNDLFVVGGSFGLAAAKITGAGLVGDFKVAPNLRKLNYNQLIEFIEDGDDLVLSTDKGFLYVAMRELLDDPTLPVPARANVFSLTITAPFSRRIAGGDTLVLPQTANTFRLDAVNYLGYGKLSFRYLIEAKEAPPGFQETQIGEIFIGNLRPGQYYPVTCVLTDDAWQSKPYTFYLYRRPYWYQTQGWTRIFWIGGALLFFIFVGAVILLTRSVVQRSNEKRRQLIELELRALYAQINPHFIFNSLNSAQYFINARHIDKAYDHVNKFARLLRAYLKSSHDRYITVAEEVNMLHYYIELQQERFREPFEYNIRVDNKIPAANVQIPSLLLQPLVENAINHGLFHKKEKGHLNIEFMQGTSNDELICIIEDDGVGRERAREIGKADKGSRFGSYGTRLTEQLINIFERYEQMNIQVSYQDKAYPNTGTIVTLTIRNVRYVA